VARLTVRSSEGVVYLSGEFDLAEVENFSRQTTSTIAGRDEVVLDLSGVTFLDSSGMNAIIWLAQCVGGRGFVLRNPQPGVARVLAIARIADIPGIQIEQSERPDGPER
jgi:anti-sigma B factor antagonist